MRWPRLYHMAESGSFESIRNRGLLSTSALLDLYGIVGEERRAIEAARRPTSITLSAPMLGTVTIRDNKPIVESVLKKTLTGSTLEDWYKNLNRRVFFWLTPERLDRMRNAKEYAARPHELLVLSTSRLLQAYGSVVELSPINSGAVHPSATYPRGPFTFQKVTQYPWAERMRAAPREPVVELTVPHAVYGIDRFTESHSTL